MTVAFGSSSSTTYAGRAALTVTAPPGIADGDVLLALIIWADSGNTLTPPSGWAQVGSGVTASDGSFLLNSAVFTKVAAGESGDYTWTLRTTGSTQGLILRYSGANGDVNAFSANMIGANYGTQDRDATSITTDVDGCVLAYLGFDWGDYTADLTPPTGFDERVEVNPLIYAADALQVTAGATGTVTMQCNASVIDPRGAWLVALEPTASGSVASGAGSSNGSSTAIAVAVGAAAAVGHAQGSSTVSGAGAKKASATASASGTSSAIAHGAGVQTIGAVGSAEGTSTVVAFSRFGSDTRTIILSAEDRALSVAPENRTLRLEQDQRVA
ncbi:hypothetical protein [Rhizobium ruizarguesonis]|uniref:hypothetical protein n=1 Tax=Rhizobium ruizarguesonis TaxID=2081791 RepID=UPI0010324E65|nr:hypothetical protein [Rhizobium ruizarguesonis]TBE67432.1 hypothetical protein ELH00_16315 [Rhizobium ruizarguesonis]